MIKRLYFLLCSTAGIFFTFPVAAENVVEVSTGTELNANLKDDTTVKLTDDIDLPGGFSSLSKKGLIIDGQTHALSGQKRQIYSVITNASSVTFRNITLRDFRRANDRGGFYVELGSHASFDNVIFENISAPFEDGGWYAVYGGVINVADHASLSVSNSLFQNNYQYVTVYKGYANVGGVIHIQGDMIHPHSVLEKLEHSRFINNTLEVKNDNVGGGAIYLEGVANSIVDNFFSHNTIKAYSDDRLAYGGAIALGDGNEERGIATIEKFTDGTFEANGALAVGNNGKASGGALYISVSGHVAMLKNMDFNQNYVQADIGSAFGGGLANYSVGGLSLTDTVFRGNYARGKTALGGALYNDGIINKISASSFSGNHVSGTERSDGGAIYNTGTINLIVNTDFIGNTAGGLGGAVYSTSDIHLSADGYKMKFTGNSDGNGNNDIYLAGGNLDINLINGGSLVLDGGINGSSAYDITLTGDGSGQLDLNAAALNAGQVSLSDAVVNLKREEYLNNVSLSLNNVELNLANNTIGTLNIMDFVVADTG